MVNLVLVAHSRMLAEGLREMAGQIAGDAVRIATAGGTEDGRLGTNAFAIADAIRSVEGNDGVLVLIDLGSAALSTELALAELTEEQRSRVIVSSAPFVEGTILAAVEATLGSSLAEVAAAATRAVELPKMPQR
jgi:dihydroxyacetone kinase phosphotransfer subunit